MRSVLTDVPLWLLVYCAVVAADGAARDDMGLRMHAASILVGGAVGWWLAMRR